MPENLLGTDVQSAEAMLVLSDSLLPSAQPHDDTLLPCSPTQLLNTDVSAKTLRDLVSHEESVEAEVWGCMHKHIPNISRFIPNVICMVRSQGP